MQTSDGGVEVVESGFEPLLELQRLLVDGGELAADTLQVGLQRRGQPLDHSLQPRHLRQQIHHHVRPTTGPRHHLPVVRNQASCSLTASLQATMVIIVMTAGCFMDPNPTSRLSTVRNQGSCGLIPPL